MASIMGRGRHLLTILAIAALVLAPASAPEAGGLRTAATGVEEVKRPEVGGLGLPPLSSGAAASSLSDLSLPCTGQTYDNRATYQEGMADVYDAMGKHYSAVAATLAGVEGGLAAQCRSCRSAVASVGSLGLGACHPALASLSPAAIAADPSFGPALCSQAAQRACGAEAARGIAPSGGGAGTSCEGGDLSRLGSSVLAPCAPYLGAVQGAMAKHGVSGSVDPVMVLSQMMQESSCNPGIDCGGIMQVDFPCKDRSSPLYCACRGNPSLGIDLGMKELGANIRKVQGYGVSAGEALTLVEFGYNRGQGALKKAVEYRQGGASTFDAMMRSCLHYYPASKCNGRGLGPYYPEAVKGYFDRACREIGGTPREGGSAGSAGPAASPAAGSAPSSGTTGPSPTPAASPPGESESLACPLCIPVPKGGSSGSSGQTVIVSPPLLASCELMLAELKDVCTADGSESLGGRTLDPCALGERFARVRAMVESRAAPTAPLAGQLRGLAHGQRTAVRDGLSSSAMSQTLGDMEARSQAIVQIASIRPPDGASSADFQSELSRLVGLSRGRLMADVGGGASPAAAVGFQDTGGSSAPRPGSAASGGPDAGLAAASPETPLAARVGYRGSEEPWSRYCGRFNLGEGEAQEPESGKDVPGSAASGGILKEAETWKGTPYVFGGTSRRGVDCSAFVQNVMRSNGINLPRTAAAQYDACASTGGQRVGRGSLQPGDVVFFANTYKPGISHVGIYKGSDSFIQAPGTGKQVSDGSLSSGFYSSHYAGACRWGGGAGGGESGGEGGADGSSARGKPFAKLRSIALATAGEAPASSGEEGSAGECGSELSSLARLRRVNPDRWSGAAMSALSNLASLDPDRLFVDADRCFRYSTPRQQDGGQQAKKPSGKEGGKGGKNATSGSDGGKDQARPGGSGPEGENGTSGSDGARPIPASPYGSSASDDGPCSDACRRCLGDPLSYCHPQLGRCVCSGSGRRVIDIGCAVTEGEDALVLARRCCAQASGRVMASGIAGPDEGICRSAGAAATFDLCSQAPSATGLCCLDGLGEAPVDSGCAGPAANGTWPGSTAPAPGPATAPSPPSGLIVVSRAQLLQDMVPARAFLAGEDVRVLAVLNETGTAGFAGRLVSHLRVIGRCACPLGAGDAACSCEEEDVPLDDADIPWMEPGSSWTYLSDPIPLDAAFGGTTVQLGVMALDANETEVASAAGPLLHVIGRGDVDVTSGTFVEASTGSPVTEGVVGMNVSGRALLSSRVAPVRAEAFMLVGTAYGLATTRSSLDLDAPAEGVELLTRPFLLGEDHLGWTLRLGVRVTDGNGTTLLDTVLDEEGFEAGACEGALMTPSCAEEREQARLGHPNALLTVRRPHFVVARAGFVTSDGTPTPSAPPGEHLSLSVRLENPELIPFNGTAEAWAAREDGGEVPGSRLREAVPRLGPGESLELAGPSFGAFADPAAGGGALSLRVAARDSLGTIWLDEEDAARLARGALATPEEGPRSSIDATLETGACRLRVVCEGCLATCTLHIERADCSLAARSCGCLCSVRRT